MNAQHPLNIVLLGGMAASAENLLRKLANTSLSIAAHPGFDPAVATAALMGAEVVVTPILTADMLSYTPRLRLVHSTGAGVDRIEIAALPAAVTVCNCHGHAHAMAEYALGAMLVLTRRLLIADRRLREGDWSYCASFGPPQGGELHSRHLGIVGAGEAVSALVPATLALGMSVSIVTRRPQAAAGRFYGVSTVLGLGDLPQLVPDLDYLVLAIPLTDLTRHLIGRVELSSMKDTAILVNMARGGVVDEHALFDALSSGDIGGAAIDVWSRAPVNVRERLHPSPWGFHALSNTLLTPHFAGWTYQSRLNRWRTIADNIDRVAMGQPLLNVVRSAMP